MKIIKGGNDTNLSIPVGSIDYVRWEESSGGRAFVKVGTGGTVHHVTFDDKESALLFYDEVIKALEEL